jgi:spore germination protein GerM
MRKIFVSFSLLCVLALAGCGRHTQTAPPTPPVSPSPPTNVGNVTTPVPAPVLHNAVIYTVNLTQGTDANNYLVPQTVRLTNSQDPAREAVQDLISAPHSPLPAEAKLKSIKIVDGLATMDFTQPPVNESRGEEAQSQALEALQRTLGQFPSVSRIQITVQGQSLPNLGEAAGGPMDVIRPSDKTPNPEGI